MTDKRKHDLYALIFDRTLASVMKDAKMERKVGQWVVWMVWLLLWWWGGVVWLLLWWWWWWWWL